MSRSAKILMAALALAVTLSVVSNRAESHPVKPMTAEGAVIFYRFGTVLFEVGPLPSPYDKNKELAAFRAGYKCKVFALFFAVFHKWKCEPVAMKGTKTYLDKNKPGDKRLRDKIVALNAAIGKKYPPSAIKMNFWQKHGRIVIGLLLIGLIAFGVLKKMKKSD